MINRKKTFRYLLYITILLIVVAIIGKKLEWFGGEIIYEVTTNKAEKRTIVETITANGKIQPETEVKISSDVSGEIVDLKVKEGDEVKKGDLLIKIKPDIYESSIERLQASVNSAKANLGNSNARLTQVEAQLYQTELTYNRNKKLFEQGAISQADYDNSTATYKMGKADVEAAKQNVTAAHYQVKSAEASLKEANENLIKTNIYAPMSGTISKLNVELGERVVGTMQMTGTELLRIANLNVMEVKVDVNETDIINVKINDTSEIDIDAYPNNKFKGIVTLIANSSTTTGTSVLNSDQVSNFEVKIRILPESYKSIIDNQKIKTYPFRPGMSATVDIQTKTEHDVISVPIQAVTTKNDSTISTQNKKDTVSKSNNVIKEYIFKFDNGKAVMVPVKTGIQDNNFIQIKEGIKVGDEVITAPYSVINKKLKNNSKVKKTTNNQLFNKDK